MRSLPLGTLGKLRLSADLSAIIGTALLWLALATVGYFVLHLPTAQAIFGALLAVVVHWAGETIHQLGHAWAARRQGYPMTGIRYWTILSASEYPAEEGNLPARIHIRRALGGPLVSLAVGVLLAFLAATLYPLGGLPRYISLFAAFDNLVVFGLGAFVPLGFNDGSTLLYWLRRR